MEVRTSERNPDPLSDARRVFRKDLEPQLDCLRETGELSRLMVQYKTALNEASLGNFIPESIVSAARFVAGNVSERRSLLGQASDVELDEGLGEEMLYEEQAEKEEQVCRWFESNWSHEFALLSSYARKDPEVVELFKKQVGHGLSRWLNVGKSLAKASSKDVQEQVISSMENFLVNNTDRFPNLKRIFGDSQFASEEIAAASNSAKVEIDIARLNAYVAAVELRDWTAETVREARTGRKIYETPYYSKLLKELHFLSRKKNGVGGVILYGPPGTGKTELIQEKNRPQGYKTRVINIHHYTSFADLIASSAVQVGLDQSVPLSQKLQAVIKEFEGKNARAIKGSLEALFSQLQQDGMVAIGQTFKNFVETLSPESVDESGVNWQRVGNSIVNNLRGRLLRTSLSSDMQEVITNLVEGEILLAIRNGERVILDEIDKAGPNSLGGILSFLAKSPGETLVYGQSAVKIPDWFVVDATSNSTELNEYLKDRFSHLEVGIPPAKDQLMISMVRMADNEGNILLSDYEQRQYAAFFIYVVPEINKILNVNQLSPLSNRSIQELTSYLVDFGNMERTNVSFSQAVKMLLLQNKMWSADEEVVKNINEVLKRFEDVLKPQGFGSGFDAPSRKTLGREERRQLLSRSFVGPLIVAAGGLPETANPIAEPVLSRVNLSEEQIEKIRHYLEDYDKKSIKGDVYQLPIGFTVYETLGESGGSLRLMAAPEDDSVQNLISDRISVKGRIAAASPEGKLVCILVTGEGAEHDHLSETRAFSGMSSDAIQNSLGYAEGLVKVEVDSSGKQIGILTGEGLKIGNRKEVFSSVRNFAFSPDGKLMLLEYNDGHSQLLHTDNFTLRGNLAGEGWHFVGKNLLIQRPRDGGVKQQAYLVE